MLNRAPKVPAFPGQGRKLQIEGAVTALIAVAIVATAMAVAGADSPIGFAVMMIGALIALIGVHRVWRGSMFQFLEDRIGPKLFSGESE